MKNGVLLLLWRLFETMSSVFGNLSCLLWIECARRRREERCAIIIIIIIIIMVIIIIIIMEIILIIFQRQFLNKLNAHCKQYNGGGRGVK